MLINEEHHDDDHSFCDHLISEPVKPMHILSHAFAFLVFLSGLVSLVYFYYSTSRRLKEVQQAHLAHLTSSKSEKLVTSRRNMLVLEFRAQLHLTNIFGSKPKKNTSSVDGSDSVNKPKTVNIISDPQGQRQQ
ncbi:hypothetical protein CCH79_00021005 [Gambusia affinis]|uniref:Uncharacterized protein n=1 Tax=Gambusia affinis TaxID=33528 RepID=A0A315UY90_GAMAF|nr:hypothetical protein CCH79_00021005 [Gambusia affinis]